MFDIYFHVAQSANKEMLDFLLSRASIDSKVAILKVDLKRLNEDLVGCGLHKVRVNMRLLDHYYIRYRVIYMCVKQLIRRQSQIKAIEQNLFRR